MLVLVIIMKHSVADGMREDQVWKNNLLRKQERVDSEEEKRKT